MPENYLKIGKQYTENFMTVFTILSMVIYWISLGTLEILATHLYFINMRVGVCN